MKYLIIILSKLVYFFTKILGIKNSLSGKMAFHMDESILKKIYLPDNIILVTGSSGKASITQMIYKVLRNAGFSVACNIKDNKEEEYFATTILNNTSLSGMIKKDVILVACEPLELNIIFQYFKPKYLVVTNIHRNQMMKYGHPEFVYDSIQKLLTHDIHLVLNSDDPISAMLGYKRDNVTFFGINKNEYSYMVNSSIINDAKYCPICKNIMEYEYYNMNDFGKYHCKKCGHMRKTPDYAITNVDLKQGQLIINKKHHIKMKVRSMYNAYNLLTAFCVARIFGVDEEKIVSTLTDCESVNNDIEEMKIRNLNCNLLYVKNENPISYNQAIDFIINSNKKCNVIIEIEDIDSKNESRETSWLWDIDFGKLNDNLINSIYLTGKYAEDVLVRLQNAEMKMDKIFVKNTYNEIESEMMQNTEKDIYVITSLKDRKKLLERRK